MPSPSCEHCGAALPLQLGRGRRRAYCSRACQQAAYRARNAIPVELRRLNRWVRCVGKRPIMPSGRAASSTDPSTWSPWAAVQSGSGDGLGIMLGDGLGCYDLDHVTDEEARRVLAIIPESIIFIERSMSGSGVHIFVRASESAGWKRRIDGISVERYTRARFIRMTGKRITI